MAEDIICRLAEERDLPQVQALWGSCFDDTPSFVQWYFSRYYRSDCTLGILAGQTLYASAQMIPYTISLRDAAVSCAYIVGVDTAPQARNRGYAKQLLLACLKEQRRRKQPISLLMPFEGQFYYRYGWPFCYFHQRLLLNGAELRCAAKAWGTVRQVDLLEAQAQLATVYEQFTKFYHGTVMRSAQQWRFLLEDAALEDTLCFVIEDETGVQGYCLWTPLKDKVFIRELAWCHEQAKQGLLWFLQEHLPEQQTLWLELPQEDALVYQLATAKTAAVQYPFLMARIVDVVQCLEAISYPPIQAELMLTVQDTFADWNQGVFLLQVAHGKGSVQKCTAEAAKQSAGVWITIEALSQLVLGARSAEQLQRQGVLQAEDVSLIRQLEWLWPPKHTYINEYY